MIGIRPAALLPGGRPGRVALGLVLAAFAAVRILEAAGRAPRWVAAWLDDVLALPLVLTLALAAHRLAGLPAARRLPRRHGLLVLAAYAVFFELVLPRLDRGATADPLDVLAYAAGWLLFEAVLNAPGGGADPVPTRSGADPGRR